MTGDRERRELTDREKTLAAWLAWAMVVALVIVVLALAYALGRVFVEALP